MNGGPTATGDLRFALPDLGEGLVEAELVRWLVAVGDRITADQPVAEVETAKTALDLPCPYAGVVTALHGEPGDLVPVGAPLVTVAAAPEAAGPPEPDGPVLVGYGPAAVLPAPRPVPRPAAPAIRPTGTGTRPAVVSPVVRKLARDHGITLTALRGSGPGGLILRADVEAAIALRTPGAGAPVRLPLRGRSLLAAEKFTRSHQDIPRVTIWQEADVTGLLARRDALHDRHLPCRTGLPALFGTFCIEALALYPRLNAHVDTARREILQFPGIGLGIAVQAETGLVVPVLRNVQQYDTDSLVPAIHELVGAARAGTLAPADMSGGTFTLNNYGMFGVAGATPLLNIPEAAMLGIGSIASRPWVVEEQLAVRKVATFSLTFDHRVCDGETAAAFLRHVIQRAEGRPATAVP
ncbi:MULTISPECIES: dihydrolipoamide acetyltransferase family protein [Streptomyces]|uniref:dihydrolipoamide acetyltransferase family protein n=1 Tax=Streptomyces TaxID=1883 RepID=UPI000B9EDC61|nr:dihydrolipoamide acetyltransferase family protein [Streptomyces kasugaensis]